MICEVLILEKAKKDVRDTSKWYNQKQKGLGLRFVKHVRSNLKFISNNPLASINRYKNIHTTVMFDFPYMIHYRIDEINKIVVVISVLHTSLNPNKNWTK